MTHRPRSDDRYQHPPDAVGKDHIDPPGVKHKVSIGGVIRVAGQPLRVGHAHCDTIVNIHVQDTEFKIYDLGEDLLDHPANHHQRDHPVQGPLLG